MALEFSPSECHLLHWLEKADDSAYGECKGKDLDRLKSLGYVTYDFDPASPRADYGRVKLTDEGKAAASRADY